MSQLFRRKPIAALMANEGAEHSLARVPYVPNAAHRRARVGRARLGRRIMIGLPAQAWERFGLGLAAGLVVDCAYGYRPSRLRDV